MNDYFDYQRKYIAIIFIIKVNMFELFTEDCFYYWDYLPKILFKERLIAYIMFVGIDMSILYVLAYSAYSFLEFK